RDPRQLTIATRDLATVGDRAGAVQGEIRTAVVEARRVLDVSMGSPERVAIVEGAHEQVVDAVKRIGATAEEAPRLWTVLPDGDRHELREPDRPDRTVRMGVAARLRGDDSTQKRGVHADDPGHGTDGAIEALVARERAVRQGPVFVWHPAYGAR